jgi:DNA-binding NtrC family response regulator
VLLIVESAAANDLHRLINLGAVDFCLAPLRLEELLPRIQRWSVGASRSGGVTKLLEKSLGLRQLVGQSRAFVEAINTIPKLAGCAANVLITGETGTGKEMCARSIHQLGPRADHPFVPVNCGAIPSELVENELFGHHAGAFTGASSAVPGLLHDAEGGTLFLDEIDALPLHAQVKFLRFLHDQEYRPLGARKSCQADIRVIAASNTDVEAVVRSGRFRADLFYRLNILPLKLPALRERLEDIPMLARHFVTKHSRELPTRAKELSLAALEKLLLYPWPGNVRELENVIERAVVLADQPVITSEDICLPKAPPAAKDTSFKAVKAHAVAEFETAYVRRLLAAHDGNISKAARAAKKNRRAFWELMRKHNIVPPAAAASS